MLQTSGNRCKLRLGAALSAMALPAVVIGMVTSAPAQAASSKGCEGGGFTVLGRSVAFDGSVAAPAGRFSVVGRYVRFDVDPVNLAVHNYVFTKAPNELSMTGGIDRTVFASKVPSLPSALTSAVSLEIKDDSVELARSGPGATMKLQAKDCAAGGVFQMEPERGDGGVTRIVHTLAPGAFYFDNPNFRARLGQFLGSGCTSTAGPAGQFCVKVGPRVNIAYDGAPRLIARDSSQVATRVKQPVCGPDFAAVAGDTADHCGGVSVWDVSSGGVEVANPPTTCTSNCQAQNQVRGRLAVLGFPSPVPAASRLTPRTP